MFGFKTRAHRPLNKKTETPQATHRIRPMLEALEHREVPAAPIISNLSVQAIAGNLIVTGQVQDESIGNVTIDISGSVNGTVHSDNMGAFILVAPYSGLIPVVTAQALDIEGLYSTPSIALGQPALGDEAPLVTLGVVYGNRRTVTLSGTVYDEHPGGLVVTLSGVIGTQNVTTDGQGNFALTTEASSLGNISAHTFDAAGHGSNTATVTLTSNNPVITDFQIVCLGGNSYKISGTVADESPGGLVVHLTSSISGFDGLSITVCDDGTFSRTITIADPISFGSVTATVTDWWGLSSDPKELWFGN